MDTIPKATRQQKLKTVCDPGNEEQAMREGESPTSLAVTDADMAEEDANEAVSIHSSSTKSPKGKRSNYRSATTEESSSL